MSSTHKRRLMAMVPDGVVAPRAAIIGVSVGDDGRPVADIPVAVVVQGDEVIWSAPAELQRPFQIEFDGAAPQSLPDVGRGEPVQVGGDCDVAVSRGPLTRSDATLPSAPMQTVRMRISRDAMPGRYRYLLSMYGDRSVDPERPPFAANDLILAVVRGPIVDDGDGPVPVN